SRVRAARRRGIGAETGAARRIGLARCILSAAIGIDTSAANVGAEIEPTSRSAQRTFAGRRAGLRRANAIDDGIVRGAARWVRGAEIADTRGVRHARVEAVPERAAFGVGPTGVDLGRARAGPDGGRDVALIARGRRRGCERAHVLLNPVGYGGDPTRKAVEV